MADPDLDAIQARAARDRTWLTSASDIPALITLARSQAARIAELEGALQTAREERDALYVRLQVYRP